MYNSIVTVYKQNKNEYSKVKVHLQKKTNYHTKPIFYENIFLTICLLISCTLSCLHNSPCLCLQCAGLNTYGLSGRTYASTWGEDMRSTFAGSLFRSPLGWVSVTCSLSGSDRCSASDSTAGQEFGLLTRNLILLQQHHKPYRQCCMERGNHVSVEIPCFSLGQRSVCSKNKTSGSAPQLQ